MKHCRQSSPRKLRSDLDELTERAALLQQEQEEAALEKQVLDRALQLKAEEEAAHAAALAATAEEMGLLAEAMAAARCNLDDERIRKANELAAMRVAAVAEAEESFSLAAKASRDAAAKMAEISVATASVRQPLPELEAISKLHRAGDVKAADRRMAKKSAKLAAMAQAEEAKRSAAVSARKAKIESTRRRADEQDAAERELQSMLLH